VILAQETTTYGARPRGASESPTGSSPADAALEIARFGSAVLRQVWSPEELSRLREAIVGFCDRRAQLIQDGMVDRLMRQYHEMGTTVLTWLIYEGRIDLEFLSEMFRGSFYHELCKVHFDDDKLFIAPDRIGSRNLRPPYSSRAALPFHQDSVEQDRRVPKVLNCWIPLDPGAGLTAPGVEVVRNPGRPKFPLKDRSVVVGDSRYEAVAIDRDRIVAEYGDEFWAPSFELGDGFVFSEHVIHRTHMTSQMTQPRIGFEFRVFSLKHLAPGVCAEQVASQFYPLV
jgi:hypothetical protein